MRRGTQAKVAVLTADIDTYIFAQGLIPKWRWCSLQAAGTNGQPPWFPLLVPLQSAPPISHLHPRQEIKKRTGLCHRHSDLFDEASQVYVSFRKTSTLMGAQGDMDLNERKPEVQWQASTLPGRATEPPAVRSALPGTAGQ